MAATNNDVRLSLSLFSYTQFLTQIMTGVKTELIVNRLSTCISVSFLWIFCWPSRSIEVL
jgi:hypothetical protein